MKRIVRKGEYRCRDPNQRQDVRLTRLSHGEDIAGIVLPTVIKQRVRAVLVCGVIRHANSGPFDPFFYVRVLLPEKGFHDFLDLVKIVGHQGGWPCRKSMLFV
jgi:hypothetical protein